MTDQDSISASEACAMGNAAILLSGQVRIAVEYKNHRGETRMRSLRPQKFWYGISEYHANAGRSLFLSAWCFDHGATRDFRVADFNTQTLMRVGKT